MLHSLYHVKKIIGKDKQLKKREKTSMCSYITEQSVNRNQMQPAIRGWRAILSEEEKGALREWFIPSQHLYTALQPAFLSLLCCIIKSEEGAHAHRGLWNTLQLRPLAKVKLALGNGCKPHMKTFQFNQTRKGLCFSLQNVSYWAEGKT